MLLPLLLACAPEPEDDGKLRSSGADDSGAADDTGDTGDTGTPAEGCRAEPAAADRARVAVASLPYTTAGGQADVWAVMEFSAAGVLSDAGTRFSLGRATSGEVVFTPDGSVGVTVQEDGSLGVFLVEGDGAVTVVEAAWTDGFYASRAVPDPSGEVVWVVDGNWANNGGGLYRVPLSCDDGAPGPSERVLEAKLPADLLLAGDRAVFVAQEVEGTADGDDAALLTWDEGETLGGADLFDYEDAIVSDGVLTPDGAWAFVGDFSFFSGVSNRVAVAAVTDDALAVAQTIEVEDPVALVAWDDVVLVASGYGDALVALVPDPSGDAPFRSAGEVVGSELPSGLALLARGEHAGTVLVGEVSGVRAVRIDGEDVDDLGRVVLSDGMDGIVGAVGVQP